MYTYNVYLTPDDFKDRYAGRPYETCVQNVDELAERIISNTIKNSIDGSITGDVYPIWLEDVDTKITYYREVKLIDYIPEVKVVREKLIQPRKKIVRKA